MARVAFIKLFTGLNLGVSQLSAELQRAGHDTRIIYFKDYVVLPEEEAEKSPQTDLCGMWIAARARKMNINCYKPITEREYELLFQVLDEFRPDLIGFGLTTVPFRECGEVTRRVKERFDAPVIWGGSGATLEPERALRHADMVCVGEGEELIVELAAAIDAGADYSTLRNLWLRKDGEIIRNPGRPLVDLEKIAIPDFDVSRCFHVDDDRLRRDVYPPNLGRQYCIMTQRGCPYSCSFCIESVYQEKYGHSVRRRSVDVVIEEAVRAKEQLGIKAIVFYDDVFTTHPRWLREFAPRYKAEVGLPFWCYTYPRTTRKEEILMLKDAGLAAITIGIQSGSAAVLEQYNRPIPAEMSIQAAQILVDCGVDAFFDLITQSEFETEDTCRETFDFLLSFPRAMKTVGFYPMVKFPTYGFTDNVERQKRTLALGPDDYEYWHRMYLLTRTDLPAEKIREIAASPEVRRNPSLVDPLLPETLPFFYLDHYAIDLEDALGHDLSAGAAGASRRAEAALAGTMAGMS
jgi:radical SAM superfamily enzyme YgiQ (UPF0313 family)